MGHMGEGDEGGRGVLGIWCIGERVTEGGGRSSTLGRGGGREWEKSNEGEGRGKG